MNSSAQLILDELTATLALIDERQLDFLCGELLVPSRRVFVMGVGRVLISLKAWVKRMRHLGIDINYVGDETELPMREDDLLIVGSSSGESTLPVAIAQIAKRLGGEVFYVGCTSESTIAKLSDAQLIVRGRTKYAHPDEYPSRQPMSTLFEQQLYLLGDVIALEVMKYRGWSEDDIRGQHANLE